MAQVSDLDNRFTHHPPKVVAVTPPSREQALALTKLEEAVMWANASIARNE